MKVNADGTATYVAANLHLMRAHVVGMYDDGEPTLDSAYAWHDPSCACLDPFTRTMLTALFGAA